MEDFDCLSVRARNVLKSHGIMNEADLRAYWHAHGEKGVLRFQNFGRKSLNEVRETFDLPRAKDVWDSAKTLQAESRGVMRVLHLARKAIQSRSPEDEKAAIRAIDFTLERLF